MNSRRSIRSRKSIPEIINMIIGQEYDQFRHQINSFNFTDNEINQLLLILGEYSNVDEFKFLFNHPKAITARQNLNINEMLEAIIFGNKLPIIQYLLDTILIEADDIIYLSIDIGNLEILKYLLTRFRPTIQHLRDAVKMLRFEILQYLLTFPEFKNYDPTELIKLIIIHLPRDEKLRIESLQILRYLLKYLYQHPHLRKSDLIKFNPETISILIKYPEILKEFMLYPPFFNKFRNLKELEIYYTQALNGIPSELEEALMDTQPGTLKDTVRYQVLERNLK